MQRFLVYLFLQKLYMFQAVPPPIIRQILHISDSDKPVLLGALPTTVHITVHTASDIVNQYCCQLLPWKRWSSICYRASCYHGRDGVPSHPR